MFLLLIRSTWPSQSPKFSNQSRISTYQALHDLFPTESTRVIRYWLSRGWVDWILIDKKFFIPTTLDPYKIISWSTQPLPAQYPITSQLLLDRHSAFLTVKNYAGNLIDATTPTTYAERARPVPKSQLLDRAWRRWSDRQREPSWASLQDRHGRECSFCYQHSEDT